MCDFFKTVQTLIRVDISQYAFWLPGVKDQIWFPECWRYCFDLDLIILSGGSELPSPSGEQNHTAPSCKQPVCPRWAVGQPDLHTVQQEHSGPHCTSSPLQGTSRLRLHFKWLISCGYNQFTSFLKAIFLYRAVDSGVRMQSGTTHWDATSTNTFWNSRHPLLEPAGQLRFIQCCCS